MVFSLLALTLFSNLSSASTLTEVTSNCEPTAFEAVCKYPSLSKNNTWERTESDRQNEMGSIKKVMEQDINCHSCTTAQKAKKTIQVIERLYSKKGISLKANLDSLVTEIIWVYQKELKIRLEKNPNLKSEIAEAQLALQNIRLIWPTDLTSVKIMTESKWAASGDLLWPELVDGCGSDFMGENAFALTQPKKLLKTEHPHSRLVRKHWELQNARPIVVCPGALIFGLLSDVENTDYLTFLLGHEIAHHLDALAVFQWKDKIQVTDPIHSDGIPTLVENIFYPERSDSSSMEPLPGGSTKPTVSRNFLKLYSGFRKCLTEHYRTELVSASSGIESKALGPYIAQALYGSDPKYSRRMPTPVDSHLSELGSDAWAAKALQQILSVRKKSNRLAQKEWVRQNLRLLCGTQNTWFYNDNGKLDGGVHAASELRLELIRKQGSLSSAMGCLKRQVQTPPACTLE